MVGGGPLTVTSTSFETAEVSLPLLKNTVPVFLTMPLAAAFTVTWKLKLALAPAVNVSSAKAIASTVDRSLGATLT